VSLKFKDSSLLLPQLGSLNEKDLATKYFKKKKSPLLAEALRYTSKFDNVILNGNDNAIIDFKQFLIPFDVAFPNYNGHEIHDQQLYREIVGKLGEYSLIFTDGSKSYDGGGCAFFVVGTEQVGQYKLHDFNSVYTAEALAILEALKHSKCKKLKKVAIFSDSYSVLQSLVNRTTPCKTNKLIMEIIGLGTEMMVQGFRIKFMWVRGHVGIGPNEVVDALAKRATTEGELRNRYVSLRELRAQIVEENVRENWNDHWKKVQSLKQTQYARVHPTIPIHHWYENNIVDRKFFTTMARLKFGHGRFPRHLHKINIIDSPECSCGAECADLDHLIFQCPLLKTQIDWLLTELVKLRVALPADTVSLLHTNRYDVYKLLYNYLERAKLSI